MATYNMIITCRCGNPTEHYCNTCGENLCSNCKETHLQDDETRQHFIVEYTEKLMPGQASNRLCPYHNGQVYTKWCKTCKKAACIDCITSSHIGHGLVKLETVLQEKRARLQKELENLESTDLNEWKNLTTEARKATTDFLEQVNGIEKELENMAKRYHKKVDEILENNKRQLKDLTTSSFSALHEQEKRVSDGLMKVKQEIKECEDRLRSNDMENLLKHERTKPEKKILPQISSEVPPAPIFIPGQVDRKLLTEMFGKLSVPITEGDKNHSQLSTVSVKKPILLEVAQPEAAGPSKPIQASSGDTRRSGSDNTVPDTRLLQLMSEPSVQSELDAGDGDMLIACAGSDQAWVQVGNALLYLMDRHCSVKELVQAHFYFNDIALSSQGDLLLSNIDDNCIILVLRDKMVQTLFKTQVGWFKPQALTPSGLCWLQSGDIAVSFHKEGRVIIYSISGKVIKELDKKLFTCPRWVAQSKVNSDLYIIDKTDNSQASTGKVLALGKDFKVRNEYTGQGDKRFFQPCGLCTDNIGNVLITDPHNNSVHILDKDGKFLQYLLTRDQGLERPRSIDVDSEGNAWVGLRFGVKIVKYLQ